jgi:hypothetical protein
MDLVVVPVELAAVQRRMQHLGFELLERPHPNSPGHSGLIVAIRPQPTRQHFDPEAIHLPLADAGGNVSQGSLHLGSTLDSSRRVAPGRLVVSDRVDKRLGFFTFGAWLTVLPAPEATYFAFQSSAPVLELSSGARSTAGYQLAAETEALLARARVRWGRQDSDFLQRLGQIDPLSFYIATVHSILSSYATAAVYNGLRVLCSQLREERRWLQQTGRWPAQPQTLDQLLLPQGPA